MLDGRRKSIQPMAERLPDVNMQALQHFVNQSTWDPVPVARRIVERILPLIGPEALVVDDVSEPKDGRMSAGVAPQSLRGLGKEGKLPGRGQHPRRDRSRVLPAVPAKGVGFGHRPLAQVYVGPSPRLDLPQAVRALAAYQRLALEPGEARDVALYVDARRLSIWCRHPPLGAQRRPARRGGRLLLA